MQYELRDYQKQASDAAVRFFQSPDNGRNAVIVAATGAGKSLIIADIAYRLNDNVLVFCPTKEILQQNYRKMKSYGVECSMYSASVNQRVISQVTFCTIGSVKNQAVLFEDFKYIIIDECHLVSPEKGMYKAFLNVLKRRVLGLTATPYRLLQHTKFDFETRKMIPQFSELRMLDGFKDAVFHDIICDIEAADLTQRGYLCPMRYYSVPPKRWNQLEGKLFKNAAGSDYRDSSVRWINKETDFRAHMTDVVRRLLKPKSGVPRNGILVFTRYIEDAEYLEASVAGCRCITGKFTKKNRERVLKDFEEGRIKVLANAGVLIVGYDRPDLDTVVMATPTLSLARYYQEIGRALRPHPSKSDAWLVDLCGNYGRFGKVTDLRLGYVQGRWNVYSNGRQMTNVPM